MSENNRARHLGFARAVGTHIDPVMASFGMTRNSGTDTHVQYRSASMTLEISLDPYSFQIEGKLTWQADPRLHLSLDDLLVLSRPPESSPSAMIGGSTSKAVEQSVKSIAGFIRENCGPMFQADKAEFQRLAHSARDRNSARTKHLINAPHRAEAQQAWEEHNFHRVLTSYEKIPMNDLTDLESRRLEYARNQVHSTTRRTVAPHTRSAITVRTWIDPLGRPGCDGLVSIDLADRYAGDPDYVHGAIELEIGGVILLDRSMWDLIDQLWAYWVMAIEQALFAPGAEFHFPDQPIRVALDSRNDPWEITVSYRDPRTERDVIRSACAPRHELITQLLPAAIDALEHFQRLVPRNAAGFAELISTARRLLDAET